MPVPLGEAASGYRPRAASNPLKEILEDGLEELLRVYDERFRALYGPLHPRVRELFKRYLPCGDPHFGFLRLRCFNPDCPPHPEEESPFVRLRRKNWARLIARTYLEDPALCPSCGQEMRIVAALTSPHQDQVIEKILRCRGEWDPPWRRTRKARGPPPAQGTKIDLVEGMTFRDEEEYFHQVSPADDSDT